MCLYNVEQWLEYNYGWAGVWAFGVTVFSVK